MEQVNDDLRGGPSRIPCPNGFQGAKIKDTFGRGSEGVKARKRFQPRWPDRSGAVRL